MGRLFLTLMTVAAMLLCTGAMNIVCACGPGPSRPSSHAAFDPPAPCNGCCSETPTPAPGMPPAPRDGNAERCPCLHWTSVPLSTPDTLPGAVLVKHTLAAAPFLLLEAASSSLRRVAAATPREWPHGPRDFGVHVQAWICVWTT